MRPGSQAVRHERALHARRTRPACPGFHGHAPEDLVHAELGLDRADEIVRADGDTARGHKHVVLEPAGERLPVRVLVVGDSRQALDGSARRP